MIDQLVCFSSQRNIMRIFDRLRHMRGAITRARLCTRLKYQRRTKKSTPCLIKKASRCAADRTSKRTAYRKNMTKDPERTKDPMRTQDPSRTQDSMRTQDPSRTQDPMRTKDLRRT